MSTKSMQATRGCLERAARRSQDARRALAEEIALSGTLDRTLGGSLKQAVAAEEVARVAADLQHALSTEGVESLTRWVARVRERVFAGHWLDHSACPWARTAGEAKQAAVRTFCGELEAALRVDARDGAQAGAR